MLSTVDLPSGRKIRFPSFDPYWARYLWGGESYERDVELILRHLDAIPDKLLIDCGANIGYWTVRGSETEFGFRKILAVEANPHLIPLLSENLRLNHIAGEIIHAAIAEEEGRIVLLGGTDQHAVASVGGSGIPVPTVSLAGLIGRYRTLERTVVVKLDVEGSEISALRGAPKGGDFDLYYIAEDWPCSGMPVVQFLLELDHAVIGVGSDGRAEQIRSVEEAIGFNRRTTNVYGPSNFLACDAARAGKLLALFHGG